MVNGSCVPGTVTIEVLAQHALTLFQRIAELERECVRLQGLVTLLSEQRREKEGRAENAEALLKSWNKDYEMERDARRIAEARVKELESSMASRFQREHLKGDGPEIDRWRRRVISAEYVSRTESLQKQVARLESVLAAEFKCAEGYIAAKDKLTEELSACQAKLREAEKLLVQCRGTKLEGLVVPSDVVRQLLAERALADRLAEALRTLKRHVQASQGRFIPGFVDDALAAYEAAGATKPKEPAP